MNVERIQLEKSRVTEFCFKWKIRRLSLFGSVLRPDFSATSDVDVLVDFEEGAPWSLFDLVEMRDELSAMLGRDVDLVETKSLVNPFRRREILSHAEVVYAA
ncbi:MAG: nucleotidyltransferase family protein [Verrucomicrobia bacterium]|nr:nucleotidyltransferase family protein [Verrucomicrobiota bacterium]